MLPRNVLRQSGGCPRAALCRALTTEASAANSNSASSSILNPQRTQRVEKSPHISTAIVLNRSPLLTRTPSPFEQAYYSYQARIRRALSNPFPYDFYFKQGSLLETRFNLEERKRERQAFGPSFVPTQNVDEEKAAADKSAVEQLAQQESQGEELTPKTHPSDSNDVFRSLDRKGKRNLYLLLLAEENGKDVWRFPQGDVERGDLLHQAAQKELWAECGEWMDTWIVGRHPIGVFKQQYSQETETERVVFFFKAHIITGQAYIDGKSVKDFAWLAKEEIGTRVEQDYWGVVKDLLSER